MPFSGTNIEGLLVFEPTVFKDARGYFFESYNQHLFEQGGIAVHFVQDNQSRSGHGVIRGLHYQQNPHAQVKLIRVIEGAILDVAVDIRNGSPTFGQHFSIELSSENNKQLFIPEGFAHGFSVISEIAVVLYKCNTFYNKQSEAGINFNDEALGLDWKIDPSKAIISEKDKQLPALRNCISNFEYKQ